MQKYLPKIFLFIDEFNIKELKSLNKNINLIYRNYKKIINENAILSIKNFCKLSNRKFYLSNNLKIAVKLKLDGVYIPSFNNLNNFKNLNKPQKFDIIGSAHNKIEIKKKIKQGCSLVFLSPLFKTTKSKYFLNTTKFNLLALNENIKFVALGGINKKNVKKINLTNSVGYAGIGEIKKTA